MADKPLPKVFSQKLGLLHQGSLPAAVRGDKTQPGRKSKLAIMPLAALLPDLGSLDRLAGFSASLSGRLEQLQASRVSSVGEESAEEARRISEETMLTQVMQWLSAGERE